MQFAFGKPNAAYNLNVEDRLNCSLRKRGRAMLTPCGLSFLWFHGAIGQRSAAAHVKCATRQRYHTEYSYIQKAIAACVSSKNWGLVVICQNYNAFSI